jgi:hypothetical protein
MRVHLCDLLTEGKLETTSDNLFLKSIFHKIGFHCYKKVEFLMLSLTDAQINLLIFILQTVS